jgi:hypothetical protein
VLLLLGAASDRPGRENGLLRPGGASPHGIEQPFQIAAEQPIGADVMLLNEGYDIPST